MKRRWITVLLAATLGMLLAGCGKDAEEEVYLKDINVDKYVTLGEYKGIEATVPSTEVTDAQREEWIQNDLSSLVSLENVENREVVEMGDIANIDYVGKKDGVAFEGGTGSGFDLGIGSGTFIPGFEEGIVGMKKGETKDITLTFPENYNSEELAGQEVVFTVTVNEIKEYKLPEITDELVASLEREDVKTAEEYQKLVENSIKAQLEENNTYEILSQVLEKLENSSTIEEAPSPMVDRLYGVTLERLTSQAGMYGVDVSYLVAMLYGGTQEEYEQTLREFAQHTAKQYLMLAAVAKNEGITITDEEMDADLKEQLGTDSEEDLKNFKADFDAEAYKEYLLTTKVCDFLKDCAKVTVAES